jgi:hypothetical protein
MKQIAYLCFFALSIFLSSCKKDNEIIIKNNSAPPDYTINNEVIDSYYNRIYITLIGRKPSNREADSVRAILLSSKIDMTSRVNLISKLQTYEKYYDRAYDVARAELLNNSDTNEIGIFITIFSQYLSMPTYSNSVNQLQYEITRLENMRKIPSKLKNETMSIETMYQTSINNYFYDQLNMGTENFVVSSFQYFLLRYPSADELEQAKKMVDGFSSFLFLKSGNTKDDYLDIFFESDYFKEGMSRYLYKKYLFKEPTTTKLFEMTNYYKQNQKFQSIQQYILSSDEYVFN